MNACHIKQLPRRSIRSQGIEDDTAVITDNARYHFRQLRNRKIFANSDIQQVGAIVFIHQEASSIRQVINVKKLPPGRSRSPQCD